MPDFKSPVLDGDGNPVMLGSRMLPDEMTRAYFASKVAAPECPHYMAKSERDAGFTKCERCA